MYLIRGYTGRRFKECNTQNMKPRLKYIVEWGEKNQKQKVCRIIEINLYSCIYLNELTYEENRYYKQIRIIRQTNGELFKFLKMWHPTETMTLTSHIQWQG